nr:retrovirus-related Pol polyprotein from transposon TNT 1-94 [Tanacetum cinerariifolium]
NKARLVIQGHTQEEGIDYEQVFAPVARIEAIRLVLAYASFMGFMVYQMDVKSAFLQRTIKEEVYVCQPLGFEDPDYPDKVYKVVKTLYGLHQAPRACDYAGTSLDRKSTTGRCQFLRCKLIFWQCKKQTVVATSSTEAEYVVAASFCAKVLWIQNQLLDYGFELTLQVVLSGMSYIKYALTINPHIYVSCIKQFWNTVVVKQTNDVTRLQALVDKKKVVITETTIRDALCLDDGKGVDCLPNEEIFAELARMGYKKPSTKLTFYKAFFSSQWKFLIHTILQSLSAKRTSWNEFSSAMASAVICLSTGRKINFSKYIFESLVRNVDSSSKFYMYLRFIQLIIQNQLGDLLTHTTKYTSPDLTQKVFANMRRVGKGFSGVETPLFEGMLVGVIGEEGDVIQDQSIPSPTPLTLPPQQPQDLPSTSQAQHTSP